MRTLTITQMAMILGLSGLSLLSVAHTDSGTSTAPPNPSSRIEGELHQEVAVLENDPGVDSSFSRLAHLHRDVIGFSVSSPETNALFANVFPSPSNPKNTP